MEVHCVCKSVGIKPLVMLHGNSGLGRFANKTWWIPIIMGVESGSEVAGSKAGIGMFHNLVDMTIGAMVFKRSKSTVAPQQRRSKVLKATLRLRLL